MQSILDIHDFDENFLERFTSQTIPIYDLWSVRPLQNEQKELISGTSEEQEKFRNFIIDHSNQDYPHPLVIVIGNAEKTNTDRMSNTSKRYFKLKFDKFKGNDLGTPLTIAGTPEPYPVNQTPPFAFNGVKSNPMNPLQGFSLGDIHGIIDRNVADATRSIKAEYEEQAARREAENIKRLAELETRMEMYKLEIRAKEVSDKEQELRRELEELERKKSEGLGTVKDYTKTIAGGILEFGKVALGLEDFKAKTEVKNEVETENLNGTAKIDDEGFKEIKDEDNLEVILNGISNLDEEQKMVLFEALIPEEDSRQSAEGSNQSLVDSNKKSENSDEEIKSEDLKIKNDEKLQTKNTD